MPQLRHRVAGRRAAGELHVHAGSDVHDGPSNVRPNIPNVLALIADGTVDRSVFSDIVSFASSDRTCPRPARALVVRDGYCRIERETRAASLSSTSTQLARTPSTLATATSTSRW
jgi:hypothetical protein